MRVTPDKLRDAELLVRAMRVARVRARRRRQEEPTDAQFAERIMLCHPRTLRKYLEGRALPALAREKLIELVKPPSRR